ncbi:MULTISPECIES: hypothetical protein [unclassified Vibrio]|uniref:hypothetical protein n=1 Tax=unclassified Vibrio TaxID=2614977 RepID=UPI001268AC68|nr:MULTISPECIES: hypothetical protein [unclassified Vibrio]
MMANKIEFAMDNVSQVAVSPINADATTKQGTGSNKLVFAGVVISQKGKPYEVLRVNADNYQDVLGKPYHSSLGKNADPMRSLAEAVSGGEGLVVRVVPAAATYPAIKLTKPAETVVITNEALSYKADLALEDGEFLALAIKDGAPSENRSITLEAADAALYGANMFVLTLSEELAAGGDETLEEWIVSLDPAGTDQMGAPAYIETVLEERSAYLKCVCDAEATKRNLTSIAATKFTGASNGDISTITTDDYADAIKALRTTVLYFNYVCGLSCYDESVQSDLMKICNDRRISGYFDIDPRLTHDAALTAKQGMNLNNHRASFVHLPYMAKCPVYKNMCVWGASGIGFAAKAKGVAKSSPVGGWHYTPAGVERAVISRSGLTPIKGVGEPNFQEMYKARLNKLATDENGALFIDDSLTSSTAENYLRFEQVVSIADAISRDFYALANRLKHQPDGTTRKEITDGMAAILEGYEAVGALVPPRNPESDGKEAWRLEVKQVEIDYWKVTWAICPTGSGRRFLGEPILIR